MRFDLERIRAGVPLRDVRYYDSLESTNDTALRLVREETIASPALVLAQTQTAGRGRGTNRWWSAPGSLTFSLIWEPSRDFDRAAWPKISLATGVAVSRAVTMLAPGIECGLHWPNDIFYQEKKLAGILVEVPALQAEVASQVVIGIGLNLNNSFSAAPDEVQARALALNDVTGQTLDATTALVQLLRCLLDTLSELQQTSRPLVEEWKSLCLLKGRLVTLRQGAHESSGMCEGISDTGALRIATREGRREFFGGVLTAIGPL